MPSYHVVLFSDPVTQQYMKEQEQAINNAIPSVTTEQATHEDSRLSRFSTKPSRMPCLMIFKDGARMQSKHSKIAHHEMINWIKGVIGI